MKENRANEEDKVYAPWTDEQVESLRRYQTLGYVHELTCIESGHGALLVETDGLRCQYCDYVQTWVPWVCISFGYNDIHPEWWTMQ